MSFKSTILRWLGAPDHQYVLRKDYRKLEDKLDAIIAHYEITLTSRTKYEIKTKNGLGFGGSE